MGLCGSSLCSIYLVLFDFQGQIPEVDDVSHCLINERRIGRPNRTIPEIYETCVCAGGRYGNDGWYGIGCIVEGSWF